MIWTRRYKVIVYAVVAALAAAGLQPLAAEERYASARPALAGGVVLPQPPDFNRDKISLDLRDMEITEALKFLALKAGLNIIPTQKVTGRVTLMVNDVSIRDVFDLMIRSNELAYEKRGDIYNVMTEEEYKSYFGKNFADTREVRVFHLTYAVPEQVFSILDNFKSSIGKVFVEQDSGTVIVLDAPERMAEITKAVEALEQKTTVKIFDLKYAVAKDIEAQLKAQLDDKKAGSIKADERTNQVVVQTLPERMADIEKLVRGLDQKTREVLIDARIIKINLTNEKSRGVEWEGLFSLGKKYGLSYIGSTPFSVVNPATTAGVFTSRKSLYDAMQYYGGDIGAYPFSGTTSSLSSSVKDTASESLHLGMIGRHDFDVLFKYLDTFGDTKILSCPQIAVINNQEAKIHVGERQAYVTTSTTTGQTTTTVSENVTYVSVGLQLSVIPTINDEGYVTMKIKPEISSVVDVIVSSSDNVIPIIDTTMAETSVMVKDGSTVMIGGLHREEEVETYEGAPFLGRIPFLGYFFSQKQKSKRHVEIVILLTPHIITGDELTTGYERDFGAKMDKAYQEYAPITSESDLSPEALSPRSYREYPAVEEEQESYPFEIKPLREN